METTMVKLDKNNALQYCMAGNAIFTIHNVSSGGRFTYKVQQKRDPIENGVVLYFVSVMTNPQTFTFIGTVFVPPNKPLDGQYRHSKKSAISKDAISVKSFVWFLKKAQHDDIPDIIEMLHQGYCMVCGRALTVPESIKTGIGPECGKRFNLESSGTFVDDDTIDLPSVEHDVDLEPKKSKQKSYRVVLSSDNKYFIFSFSFNQKVVSVFQTIPKSLRKFKKQYDGHKNVWIMPVLMESLDFVTGLIEDYGFECGDGVLNRVATAEENFVRNVKQSEADDADINVNGLGGDLLPFQKAGVQYGVDNKKVLIGDDMGLGKSPQSLAIAHVLESFPVIGVVPKTVLRKWVNMECTKWVPGRSVEMIDTKFKNNTTTADIVFINYDILDKVIGYVCEDCGDHFDVKDPFVADQLAAIKKLPVKERSGLKSRCSSCDGILNEYRHKDHIIARGFKTLIVDESQYCKNSAAKRTKIVKEIASGIDVKLLLSGTAAKNRPNELVSQLEILDMIDMFGGGFAFKMRYCGPKRNPYTRSGWEFNGASNLDELHERLRSTCMVRRRKQDVLKELPDKRRVLIPVEISNWSEYDEVQQYYYSVLNSGEKTPMGEHLKMLTKLRHLAGQGKVDSAVDWIKDFLESGEKLVVFGWHQDVIKAIANEFNAPLIYGGTSSKAREQYAKSFQEDPDCKLIVANIQAGGVGINLTAASNVLFVEQGWSPADHDQAEDRTYGRLDNVHGTTAWYILGDDTVDDDVYTVVQEKRKVVDTVLDGKEQDVPIVVLRDVINKMNKKALRFKTQDNV